MRRRAAEAGSGNLGCILWLVLLGIAAGVIEVAAGVLVTLGLFTRLAAFIAAGEMAAAYWIQHFPQGFWPLANKGEAAVLFCFVFLYLAAAGPGAWSVHGAVYRSRMSGVDRFK